MEGASASVLNELFLQKLDTAEGKTKTAAYGSNFIRDRLREECFADHILPPVPITRAECDKSQYHDTLVKTVDIEPNSAAMPVTFRGSARARVIRADCFSIPFFSIETEHFEKTEEELLKYDMPVTKLIEDNCSKDMQAIKDREFLRHLETAVQWMQTEVVTEPTTKFNGTFAAANPSLCKSIVKGAGAKAALDQTSMEPEPVQPTDITDLFKLFVKNGTYLRGDRFIITEPDFEDMQDWQIEEFGDKVKSEVIVDGYKYNTLKSRKFIRTIKTDILREGVIYAFTTPDFMGRSYTLVPVKFYIDKVGNKIIWWAWTTIGIGLGNIASIRKCELFPGSVRPTATDTGYANRLPKSVEDLFTVVNNRVASQGVVPYVPTW